MATEPSDPQGITGRLSTWVHDLQMSDVPSDVIERTKHLMLDGIGCALTSSHLPWSEVAAKGIFDMEGEGPCTVVGWPDRKLPPIPAAILNSTFTQGFELDDYHSGAPQHSVSIIFPALMAASELVAAHDEPIAASAVDGEAFLKAFLIGCEVGPRAGLALHGKDLLTRGWHSGAVQGPVSSAAATASLLGLTARQTEWALGIAATQAGGLMSAQFGSMAKRMQHGFAARNGLFGTLMARHDYTGIEQVFEVPYGGYLSVFSQGANMQPVSLPEELVKGLGEKWEVYNNRIKPYAAMAVLHGTIDCIANLQKANPDLFGETNLSNIESIVTEHAAAAYEHGGWKLPKDKLLTSLSAQMSIQYAAAAQLVDREVLMSQYGSEKLNRKSVRELADKVKPTLNKAFDAPGQNAWRTVATVTFKDGTQVRTQVEYPHGQDPALTNEEIVEKWRHLTRGILDDKRRENIERYVLSLETQRDVRELAQLLGGSVKCPIDG